MTYPITLQRPTNDVASWLLPDPDAATPTAERVLEQRTEPSLLATLGQVARSSLGRRVVTALQEALGDDLAGVVLQGWAKHRSLVEAAAATAGRPTAERTVLLAEHRIVFGQDPVVEVFLDKVPLFTLQARAQVIFEVGRVEAVVRGGRLVQFGGGHSKVTGSVALEGQEISKKTFEWQLDRVVGLGSGVDLTGGAVLWTAGVQRP